MEQTDGINDYRDEEIAEVGDEAGRGAGMDEATDAENRRLDGLIKKEADRLEEKYGDLYSKTVFDLLIGLTKFKELFGDEAKKLMDENPSKWGVLYKTKMLEELARI